MGILCFSDVRTHGSAASSNLIGNNRFSLLFQLFYKVNDKYCKSMDWIESLSFLMKSPLNLEYIFSMKHHFAIWSTRFARMKYLLRKHEVKRAKILTHQQGALHRAKPCFISSCAESTPHSKKTTFVYKTNVVFFVVPVIGVEPIRCRHHWILSPARLPIPSHRRI